MALPAAVFFDFDFDLVLVLVLVLVFDFEAVLLVPRAFFAAVFFPAFFFAFFFFIGGHSMLPRHFGEPQRQA